MGEIEHLGIICGRQWGDLILQKPAIDAAIEALEPEEITLYVSELVVPILRNNPWKAHVEAFRPSWSSHPWGHQHLPGTISAIQEAITNFLQTLRDSGADAFLVLDTDPWLCARIYEADVATTIGFSTPESPNSLTFPVMFPTNGHQSVRFHALVQTYARQTGLICPPWQPPVWQENNDRVQIELVHRLLSDALGGSFLDKTMVGIQPCGSYRTKDWLPERWGQVISWLARNKMIPIIIGVASDTFEANATPQAQEQIRQAIDFRGKLPTLAHTFHLLSLLNLLIGVDSGGGHSMAALTTVVEEREETEGKVVSVFSSTNDPNRWGVVSRNPGNIRTFCLPPRNRSRYPLGLTELPVNTTGNPYTDRIRASDVIDAVQSMLGLQ